jgi:hypothetical protein
MTVDKKLIRRAVPYVLVVAVAIGIAVRAESETNAVSSRVTKVESPCLKYGPKSKLCQESFEKALGTLTHPEACAVERKAGTLRAVRELADGLGVTFTEPCAGARLAQERQRGNERAATGRERAAANSNGSGVGEGDTSPTGEAPATTPHHDGSSSPAAPHHPAGHPGPAPPPSSGEPGAAPETPASFSPGNPGITPTEPKETTESLGSTESPSVVESASARVHEAVTGAGELLHTTTCGLTGPLLCPKP